MFKKFKDKLTEEMKQSPARLQAGMQQLAQAVSPSLSTNSIPELSASSDNFSLTEETDTETPKNSPARIGFESMNLSAPSVNSGGRKRTASVSSIASDSSFLFPTYENSASTYYLQSDMDQSASEVDDNISPQLDKVTKEQIYTAYRKMQTKHKKYRDKYAELAAHYREMERTKSKLESLLVETQDKALRRISDLKEQCQLEQQAKAHLEDALRNDIDEKDCIIESLNTKFELMKNKAETNLHENPQEKSPSENHSSELLIDLSSDPDPKTDNAAIIEENEQLKNTISKLEILVSKFKTSLKRTKDNLAQESEEKGILKRDYNALKDLNAERIKNLESELKSKNVELETMKKREEESAISLAENKLSIHRELEEKEMQIKKLQSELMQSVEAKESEMGKSRKTEENQEFARKIQELEHLLAEGNEKMQRDSDFLEKLRDKYEESNAELIIMRSKNEELVALLNSEKERLKQQLEMLENELRIKQTTCMEFREKLEESEKKLSDVVDVEKKLRKELEKTTKEHKTCENIVEELKTEVQEVRAQVEILVREKGEMTTKIVEYKKTMSKLKTECKDLKGEFNRQMLEKNEDFKKLGEEFAKKIVFFSFLEKENEQLKRRKEENSDLEEKCRAQNLEIEGYKNAEQENLKKLQDLEEKCEFQSYDIEDYKKKVEEDSEKLENLMKECELKKLEMEACEKELTMYKGRCQVFEERKYENVKMLQEHEDLGRALLEENKSYKNSEKANLKKIQGLEEEVKTSNEAYLKLKEDYAAFVGKFNESNATWVKEATAQKQTIENLTNFKNNNKHKLQELLSKIELLESEVEQYKEKIEQAEVLNNTVFSLQESKEELLAENETLKKENVEAVEKLKNLEEVNKTLKNENNEYKKISDDFELEKLDLQKENDELKKDKNDLNEKIRNLESLNNEISVNLTKSDILIQEIDSLKMKIGEQIEEIDELSRNFEESKKREMESKNEVEALLAMNKELEQELEKSKVEESFRARVAELQQANKRLEVQLDETLVTFQTKESQLRTANKELKKRLEEAKNESGVDKEEQSMRVKQLVKEFQAQLQEKEDELQAALEKRFDQQQNHESSLIRQYKEQLKDFQVELTAKSEQIENLVLENKKGAGFKDDEIKQLATTIEQMQKDHANELKEIDKKWKQIIEEKTVQIEAKHEQEVNELTREWQHERRNDLNSEISAEELESTSRVAMAAVQSNTGSFHTLQKTLLSQKRELAELRKLVKMRQETLEDSTEIEYLRNILYEYMMGKETVVLAKVIAAVVKFDQDQTSKVLKKEEDKLTLLGSLGLT